MTKFRRTSKNKQNKQSKNKNQTRKYQGGVVWSLTNFAKSDVKKKTYLFNITY